MKNKQQGFTLIELMIVVAIIGALTTFAIPAYKDYVAKSELTSGLATLKALITPAELVHQDKGTLAQATALTDLGTKIDANSLGQISIPSDDNLKFLFGSNSAINGAFLTYSRSGTGWACAVTSGGVSSLPTIDGCS